MDHRPDASTDPHRATLRTALSEIARLGAENAALRQQCNDLRQDVAYWQARAERPQRGKEAEDSAL